jgi:hypothetical protein
MSHPIGTVLGRTLDTNPVMLNILNHLTVFNPPQWGDASRWGLWVGAFGVGKT